MDTTTQPTGKAFVIGRDYQVAQSLRHGDGLSPHAASRYFFLVLLIAAGLVGGVGLFLWSWLA